MIPALIIIGIIAIFVFIIMGMYNGLVRKRINCENAWSQVDVQLKRRYDLIPNLVNTVKGYASHESETLENVIKARQQAVDASGVADQALAENLLSGALSKLFALSEAYPDLKANQNFSELQEELISTENKIGFARQHYNNTVSQYNSAVEMFPSNIIAGMFSFEKRDFFELDPTEAEAVKQAPTVEF